MGLSISSHTRTNDIAVNSFLKELSESNTRQRQHSFRNRYSTKIDSSLIKSKLDSLLLLEENYNFLFSKRSKSYNIDKIYSEYNEFSQSTQYFFGSLSSDIGVDLTNFISDLRKLLDCRMQIIQSLHALSLTETIDVDKLKQIYLKLENNIFQENFNKMKFISILCKSVISDVTVLQNLICALLNILTFKPLDAVLAVDNIHSVFENSKKKTFNDENLSYYSRRLYLINNSGPTPSHLRIFFIEFKDFLLMKFGLYFTELSKQINSEVKTCESFFIVRLINLTKRLKMESIHLVSDSQALRQSPFIKDQQNGRFQVLFFHKNEKSVCGDIDLNIIEKARRDGLKVGSSLKLKDEVNDETSFIIFEIEECIYFLCRFKTSKIFKSKENYENIHKSISEVTKIINLISFFNKNV